MLLFDRRALAGLTEEGCKMAEQQDCFLQLKRLLLSKLKEYQRMVTYAEAFGVAEGVAPM